MFYKGSLHPWKVLQELLAEEVVPMAVAQQHPWIL
jgi:hypothetical protein